MAEEDKVNIGGEVEEDEGKQEVEGEEGEGWEGEGGEEGEEGEGEEGEGVHYTVRWSGIL